MKIVNEAISNESFFYKRDILPLLLSLSVIDLFFLFFIFLLYSKSFECLKFDWVALTSAVHMSQ